MALLKELLSEMDIDFNTSTADNNAGVSAHDENPVDIVSVDMPLFIRLIEWAREDATDDVSLHDLATNARELMSKKSPLTMEDYEVLIPRTAPEEKKANTEEEQY